VALSFSRPSYVEQDAEKVRQCKKTVIWFIWFVLFVWLNQTDQGNQMNQINHHGFSAACWRVSPPDVSFEFTQFIPGVRKSFRCEPLPESREGIGD
jgi:hypothetical protein